MIGRLQVCMVLINDDVESKGLCDKLIGLMSWWVVSRCIGGDFNMVRHSSERSSDSRQSPAMLDFSKFIFDQGLMHIPLVCGNFTWSNNRDSQLWCRIDKFLLSMDTEEKFPNISQRLHRILSDHFSLLLDCGGLGRGSRYFKFENMWLKPEGFGSW
jgi:hypothetical protein